MSIIRSLKRLRRRKASHPGHILGGKVRVPGSHESPYGPRKITSHRGGGFSVDEATEATEGPGGLIEAAEDRYAELEAMTRDDLRILCREVGIAYSKLNKLQMIEAILDLEGRS